MIKRSFIKKLAKIVGHENVLSSKRDLLVYSYDATQEQVMPEVIVFPAMTHHSAVTVSTNCSGVFTVEACFLVSRCVTSLVLVKGREI